MRESLTVTTEEYKKRFLRYLAAREYYSVKASSDVEGTFPDTLLVLTRKNETREYWLEVKAAAISLGDSDFLKQLAKYLAEYLSRTPDNRFKMIFGFYRLIDSPMIDKVFSEFDPLAITELCNKLISLSEPTKATIIKNASFEDVKKFFEDTTIKEADIKSLEFAEAKLAPTPPAKPTLAEAEYSTNVVTNYGNVSPLMKKDNLYFNLFQLEVPPLIFTARTDYTSSADIFAKKPMTYPPHDLSNGEITCFEPFDSANPFREFIKPESTHSTNFKDFVVDPTKEYIVKLIINRWIKRRCRSIGLEFHQTTKTYYYPRKATGEGLVEAKWKPKERYSTRELTRSMKSEGKVNYWVHRGAVISTAILGGEFYVQIRPRFLFSEDGINIMEGLEADKKDRKFRKSKYNRNPNQLYDVRFWCRHVFPETEHLGIMSLTGFLGREQKQPVKVLYQGSVESEAKPNHDEAVDIEALDTIESTSETLDSFSGE